MRRRDLLKYGAAGALAMTMGNRIAFAKEFYPTPIDEKLFKGINRAEAGAETALSRKHVPIISAPKKVSAGKVFPVDITIGKTLHPMGPEHWIESMVIKIGNEPAGTLFFQPRGFMTPEGRFNLMLGEDLKGQTVSLVVQDQCNLHGIWEGYVNIDVV